MNEAWDHGLVRAFGGALPIARLEKYILKEYEETKLGHNTSTSHHGVPLA